MIRNAALALALAAALAGCGTAAAAKPGSAPEHPAPSATSTPPPVLSAAQENFVNAYTAALAARDQEPTESEARLASVATDICDARKAGAAQSSLLGNAGPDGRLAVRLAEKEMCPAYLPRLLIRFSGSGIANSRPFLVPSGTVTVRYHFDCASFGTGNFIADLETAGQSDDQSIANALSAGGHSTTTVYPQEPGAEYHVSVDSECSWSLILSNG